VPYVIQEFQTDIDQYNGNVWGPYEYKTEALRDVHKLKQQAKNHPAGPFAYGVTYIKRVQ